MLRTTIVAVSYDDVGVGAHPVMAGPTCTPPNPRAICTDIRRRLRADCEYSSKDKEEESFQRG
jgi:hypothetical protein